MSDASCPWYCMLLVLLAPVLRAEITVNDAWISAPVPGSIMTAGYLSLHNSNDTDIVLARISGPDFDAIEIHQSTGHDGMTGMARLDELVIPAGDDLIMRPGGVHLMLYYSAMARSDSASHTLLMEFSDGNQLTLSTPVEAMSDRVSVDNNTNRDEPSRPPEHGGPVAFLQSLLPQHLLSAMMYRIARIQWGPFKDLLIRGFIRTYDVDMSIARNPDPGSYRHFNDFFTRALREDARPTGAGVVSPVDGTVSQLGPVTNDRIVQAKGRDYSARELLGGDTELAASFANGDFITIYLSPRDYHRIHMPVDGQLESMIYIPGKLFSVSPSTTKTVDSLFARNERVVAVFQTPVGRMAMILVGAIFVGSMETVWAGEITPARVRELQVQRYDDNASPVHLPRGAEAGRFNMGSTVILLFEQDRIEWVKYLQAGTPLRLGETLAAAE